MNRSLLALLVLATVALAQHDHNHSSHDPSAIHCMQCTTELDDKCDSEDLSSYSRACPRILSGALEGTKAIGCRKILQKVGDEKNVIRECAYTGEDVDGQRKTGNSGIILYYYQCTPESSDKPCNGVSGFSIMASSLVAIVARMLM